MTSKIFFSLLATAAMLATLAASSVQQAAFVTTTTGRRVPLAHLSHLATTNVAAHLYEVTADLHLTGLDRSHDLKSLTEPSRLRPSERLPVIRIDGVDHPDLLEMQRERRGAGYVVSYLEDGPVVAVWGNDLALQPLDHATHPGLFVNLRSAQSVGNGGDVRDLHKDMMYPPKQLVQAKAEPILQTVVIPSSSSSETAALPATLRQRNSCKRASPKKLEIAVSFDRALCQKYDGNMAATIIALRSMFEEAGKPYDSQTCITFQVVLLEGSCESSSDDYRRLSQLSPDAILTAFGNIWQQSRDEVQRDIAVFISGSEQKTPTAGVAWVGGTCSTQFGYAWSIPVPAVIAHEIGHLLNADHSESGLMKKRLRGGDALEFSRESINAIEKFVENDSGSACLNEETGGGDDDSGTGGPVMPPPTRTTPTDEEEFTPPTAVRGTCASSFNRDNALKCVKKEVSINVYRDNRNVVAKTKLKIFQRGGQFQFIMVGDKSVKIKSVSILVTFDRIDTREDLPPLTKFGGRGRGRHQYKVDIGQLAAPSSSSSCCNQTYYVYVLVTHCYREDTCSEVFFFGRTTLECERCSKRRFVPMSADRKCPLCS